MYNARITMPLKAVGMCVLQNTQLASKSSTCDIRVHGQHYLSNNVAEFFIFPVAMFYYGG